MIVKYWKAILAVAVIFGSGFATGMLTSHLGDFSERAKAERRSGPKGPPGFGMRGDLLQKMQRELALTANQSQEVAAILEASQRRMKEVWDKVAPQAKEEMERTRADIRSVLTPEQAVQFDEQVRLHDEWMKKRQKEGAPGSNKGPEKPADTLKPSAEGEGRKCVAAFGECGLPFSVRGL